MITFDDARAAAMAAVESDWPAGHGTLWASFDGFEDSTHYAVNVGNEEWLVDGDAGYMIMDQPLVLVDKETGEAEVTTYLRVAARVDKMSALSTA